MSYFDSETRGSSVRSTVFPYTTLFRSIKYGKWSKWDVNCEAGKATKSRTVSTTDYFWSSKKGDWVAGKPFIKTDRKSTRLNSSHVAISYAVFCLKKKKQINKNRHKNIL